jgi:hypothetical protein
MADHVSRSIRELCMITASQSWRTIMTHAKPSFYKAYLILWIYKNCNACLLFNYWQLSVFVTKLFYLRVPKNLTHLPNLHCVIKSHTRKLKRDISKGTSSRVPWCFRWSFAKRRNDLYRGTGAYSCTASSGCDAKSAWRYETDRCQPISSQSLSSTVVQFLFRRFSRVE